jgi:PAS domain-containing protein
MSQKDIEVILTRQLASCLAMPIFIVDPSGTLIFYNESAEAILGFRFDETGEMPASEWAETYRPMNEDGELLPPESLPLLVTVTKQQPSHGRLWIRGLDGVFRHIEVSAFPLIGQGARLLGAVAIFWEVSE